MSVGVHISVRAVRRFVVLGASVASLAVVAAVPGVADAARAPRAKAAAGTAGAACGYKPATSPAVASSAALSVSARTAGAVAAGLSPFDIAKWVGEKSAGGAVGAVGGLAFDEVLKLTGLKEKLLGPDPALEALNQIKSQLANVDARLDVISGQINELTKEFRLKELNDDLAILCPMVAGVEDVYYNHFVSVVQGGLAVGQIWADYTNVEAQKYLNTQIGDLPEQVKSNIYPQAVGRVCPVPSDPNLLVCLKPQELVSHRLQNFRDAFVHYNVDLAPGLLSTYLTVHDTPASVMGAYGRYLMAGRTLNHADSVALRDFYNQFAQAEALAAWMSMEYYSVTTVDGPTPEKVLNTYKADKALEESELSPIIPEGDVVDLGQKNASSTYHDPIWALASPQTTTYWPIGVESNNLVTTSADGAGNAVKAFNASQTCSVDAPPCFKAWKIPSTVDLKALLSDNCKIDPAKPTVLPSTCKPFVPSTNYPNVGNYLAQLNSKDLAWKGVFSAPAAKQTFIWATEQRSHTTNCGYQTVVVYKDVYSRRYSFRVGLPLNFTTSPISFTSLNQMWPTYPIMPTQIPDYGVWTPDVAHIKCDAYTDVQIHSPSNMGIALVTDNTGTVDFMAQTGKAAVQDAAARTVANQAATDAKHYGRHHHGSFRGLSLKRLDREVPEAHSGEPGYLIAAHSIDGGTGFTVTTRAEGTEDTFTVTDSPSGALVDTCTRFAGGAGRHGCQHVESGHGQW